MESFFGKIGVEIASATSGALAACQACAAGLAGGTEALGVQAQNFAGVAQTVGKEVGGIS